MQIFLTILGAFRTWQDIEDFKTFYETRLKPCCSFFKNKKLCFPHLEGVKQQDETMFTSVPVLQITACVTGIHLHVPSLHKLETKLERLVITQSIARPLNICPASSKLV